MTVAVGDKVLVPEYGGTKLTFEDEASIIMQVTQLICYIVFSTCRIMCC